MKKLTKLLKFGIETNAILHASATQGTFLWYQLLNKINLYLSEISQEKYKMYEKMSLLHELKTFVTPPPLSQARDHGHHPLELYTRQWTPPH